MPMPDELQMLIQKKKYWGFLEGRDALIFWRYVEAGVAGTSSKWTERDFEQLTRWQFGFPTATQFRIVAGPMGASAPKRAEVSPERRPLLSRKYGTFAERQAAEKAKRAAAQARFQTRKNALTIHLVSAR